jgi:hypothetical protein
MRGEIPHLDQGGSWYPAHQFSTNWRLACLLFSDQRFSFSMKYLRNFATLGATTYWQ